MLGKKLFAETMFEGHELYTHGTFEKCTLELFKRIMVKNSGSLVKFNYYKKKWANDKFMCANRAVCLHSWVILGHFILWVEKQIPGLSQFCWKANVLMGIRHMRFEYQIFTLIKHPFGWCWVTNDFLI